MRGYLFVLAALVSPLLVGCGSGLISVGGTVEREGTPLTSGRVIFTPVGGGHVAVGDIQSDGTFSLTSEGTKSGAAGGVYQLRVLETEDSEQGVLRTSHEPPAEMTFEIKPDGENQFEIQISKTEGWITSQEN